MEPDQMPTPKQEGEKQDVDTHANNEKNRGMTHPRLPFPLEILNIIKATNSSDYSWIGYNFVSPPGVPVFTPSQMMNNSFQNIDVLVLGDSTNRRIYGTLKGILDADDRDDVNFEPLAKFQRRRIGENAAGLSSLAAKFTSAKAAGKFNSIRDRSLNCGPRAIKSKSIWIPQFGCDNLIGSSADEFAICLIARNGKKALASSIGDGALINRERCRRVVKIGLARICVSVERSIVLSKL
jgi:hypothetical protein